MARCERPSSCARSRAPSRLASLRGRRDPRNAAWWMTNASWCAVRISARSTSIRATRVTGMRSTHRDVAAPRASGSRALGLPPGRRCLGTTTSMREGRGNRDTFHISAQWRWLSPAPAPHAKTAASHSPLVRQAGVAHGVHAAIEPVKPSGLDAVRGSRPVRQAGPEQLREPDRRRAGVPRSERRFRRGFREKVVLWRRSIGHPRMHRARYRVTGLRVFATNVCQLRYESAARPRCTPVSPQPGCRVGERARPPA